MDEFDETVSITLSTTTPLNVSATATATGTIRDNDTPVLMSISGGSAVTEGDLGGPVVFTEFTITADRAPKSNLEVALNVTDVSDPGFVAMDSQTVTLNFDGPGGLTATHTFEIVNDNVDEASGDVTVTLPQNNPVMTGRDYTVNLSDNSATFAVTDDDTPVLSISDANPVTEGMANPVFTITADIAPKSNLTVELNVTDVDDADYVGEHTQTVTLVFDGSGGLTATHTLGISDDTTNEADGTLTVTLGEVSEQDYTVSTTDGSATVAVTDDDVPQISIAVHSDSMPTVTEDTNARFTVTASPESYRDLVINLNVPAAAASSFLDVDPAATLTLSANTGSVEYSFATEDDEIDEGDSTGNGEGQVTVSIATGTGYAASATDTTSATVTIVDDDTPRLSIASGFLPRSGRGKRRGQ